MPAKRCKRYTLSFILGLVVFALLMLSLSHFYEKKKMVQDTNDDARAGKEVFVVMATPVYTVREVNKGKSGGVSVFFDVDGAQADELILNSDAELDHRGYSRIKSQWPHLKEPSSHSRGWIAGAPNQLDQTISNEEWSGSWRGPEGEIVTLICIRRISHGQAEKTDVVTINMFYYPSSVARRMEVVIPDEEFQRIIKLYEKK